MDSKAIISLPANSLRRPGSFGKTPLKRSKVAVSPSATCFAVYGAKLRIKCAAILPEICLITAGTPACQKYMQCAVTSCASMFPFIPVTMEKANLGQ